MLKRNLVVIALFIAIFAGFNFNENNTTSDMQTYNLVVTVSGPNCSNAIVKVRPSGVGLYTPLTHMGGCSYGGNFSGGKYDIMVCYDGNFGFGNTTVKDSDNDPVVIETNGGGCNWD